MKARTTPRVAVQSAALPYRTGRRGAEVLLVTSKASRRWVAPKGGVEPGLTPQASAAKEAFEEGGVEGDIAASCIGVYGYRKSLAAGGTYCRVRVFPMRVRAEHADWPERGERERRWMSLREAASRVREPGLRRILVDFDGGLRRSRQCVSTPPRRRATLGACARCQPPFSPRAVSA